MIWNNFKMNDLLKSFLKNIWVKIKHAKKIILFWDISNSSPLALGVSFSWVPGSSLPRYSKSLLATLSASPRPCNHCVLEHTPPLSLLLACYSSFGLGFGYIGRCTFLYWKMFDYQEMLVLVFFNICFFGKCSLVL